MDYRGLFGAKPVFGMIHTGVSEEMDMLSLARREVEIYLRHGIFPLIENYFGSAEDCERVLSWMQQDHPEAVYGINILGDYTLAFAWARKYGAKFIQIDSVCGHLSAEADEEYGENLRAYRRDNPDVMVFGGVRFKYQPVRSGRSVSEDLRIGTTRCDAIVCTGAGTGQSTPLSKVEEFKAVVGDFPVIVGAGVTDDTAAQTAAVADGAIVGSWFKEGHRDVGTVREQYVEEFMKRWNQ